MTVSEMIAWLDECARFFERRNDSGEDLTHWANVFNAETARTIAAHLKSTPSADQPNQGSGSA